MEMESEMVEMDALRSNSSSAEIAYDEELGSGSEEALDLGMTIIYIYIYIYIYVYIASVHYLMLWIAESEDSEVKTPRFGAELSWKDLKVTTPDGKKVLLHDACGAVKGRFLAVMGPSGSGKVCLIFGQKIDCEIASKGTLGLMFLSSFFFVFLSFRLPC